MAIVSQFATAENFHKLKDIMAKLENAIYEAQLAVDAGIPGAPDLLKSAQDHLLSVQKVYNTYFPTGSAPVD